MNDHYLVRSPGEQGINLAVGEPYMLQEAMARLINAIDPLPPVTYPISGGEPELITEIKRFLGDSQLHIVVTNGAKQALSAAIYVGKKVFGKNTVVHPEPHWLSYPTLAKEIGGVEFDTEIRDRNPQEVTRIVSVPNNPDGSTEFSSQVDVWDAAYAHPLYGFDSSTPHPQGWASVWSAAKLFGTSGARVGWLATNNQTIARWAADYVEMATSGVCTASQRHVAGIMRDLRRHSVEAITCYTKAIDVMNLNTKAFRDLLDPHCQEIRGRPATNKGMFAFFLPKDGDKFDAALKASGIKMVPGKAFGPSYAGWYRMSLGHRHQVTVEALNSLVSEL